jgi:hypothetical protein
MQEVLRLNIGRINAMEQTNIDAINRDRPIARREKDRRTL